LTLPDPPPDPKYDSVRDRLVPPEPVTTAG